MFNKADVPVGSLMRTYHVVSDDIWKKVKEGKFQGFSVEIVYDLVSDEEDAIDYLLTLPDEVFNNILDQEIVE